MKTVMLIGAYSALKSKATPNTIAFLIQKSKLNWWNYWSVTRKTNMMNRTTGLNSVLQWRVRFLIKIWKEKKTILLLNLTSPSSQGYNLWTKEDSQISYNLSPSHHLQVPIQIENSNKQWPSHHLQVLIQIESSYNQSQSHRLQAPIQIEMVFFLDLLR